MKNFAENNREILYIHLIIKISFQTERLKRNNVKNVINSDTTEMTNCRIFALYVGWLDLQTPTLTHYSML